MRTSISRLTALGAFFVVAVAVAACGGGVSSDSVASVDGNQITTQAFNHWMYVAAKSQGAQNPGSPVIVPNDPPGFNGCIAQARHQIPSLAKTSTETLRADCKQLFTSLSTQVMQFLVQGYWYQLEANRQHIKVTDAQVQSAFAAAKTKSFPTQAQFNSFLSQTGQTMNDILFRFRINQIASKLLAKQTTSVTPAAIEQYYNSHRSQFGSPETRNIRIVLAKTAAEADAAKRAVSSGESWSKVAKQYSIDPTSKNTGGLLVGVTKGQEDQALDTASFAAPVDKLLGPVHGQFGYYVFEVTKVTQATQQSLAQATPLITQTLKGAQSTNAQNAVTKLLTKHWRPQTSCQSTYSMSDCSGYKASSAGASTSTTTTG
jgi:foldase protein PrsA